MADEAALEEGEGADLLFSWVRGIEVTNGEVERMWTNPLCPVYQPIWNHEVARADFLFQTPYCAETYDAPNAEFSKGGDVCAEGDFVGGVFVVEAMSCEECDD